MKFKKIVCSVLASAMALTALAGCGSKSNDYKVDMNINPAEKKIALKGLMPHFGAETSPNEDYTAKTVERVTGYKVTYDELLSGTNANTDLNTKMLDNAKYNFMKLTADQFADYAKYMLPLDDVLEKFGPELMKKDVISQESWDVVTINGKICGIPERASSDNIENPIVIRKDWLDELELQIPTTTTEFRDMLVAMKNKYNVAPLTFDKYTPLVYPVSAAFGIYTEWQEYEIEGKKEVRYYMDAPGYSDYVDYMAGLYKDGLIDPSVSTNEAANALQRFGGKDKDTGETKAGAYACSLWDVDGIVSSLSAAGIISADKAKTEVPETLCYLRSLKNANGEYKVYRTSGYTYITCIPLWMAKNAGYVIDWINSKLTDTEGAHNFRDIVLGEENTHWTYDALEEAYQPILTNFDQMNYASYFLTGSNEGVYTDYWKARIKKMPEMARAWELLMEDADTVGVRNITDAIPPLEKYAKVRSVIEPYAQDKFYVMLIDDKGSSKLSEYLKAFKDDGGKQATEAISGWYFKK